MPFASSLFCVATETKNSVRQGKAREREKTVGRQSGQAGSVVKYSRANVRVVDEEVEEGGAVEGGLERPRSAFLQALQDKIQAGTREDEM